MRALYDHGMRIALHLFGAGLILLYAAIGALTVNDWAVVAASGLPLDETIAQMQSAGQPYSATAGIVFAAIGSVLALGWLMVTLRAASDVSGWGAFTAWGGILSLGAPAYFAASFGNLNSVGDTFYEWNALDAAAQAMPLYVASAAAAVIAVAAAVIGAVRDRAQASAAPLVSA